MPSVKLTKTVVNNANPAAVDRFLWDSELKGFGLKVSKGGRKSYVCQYRTAGGRSGDNRRLTIGQHGSPWTVEMARFEAKQILGRAANGEDPAMEKQDLKKRLSVAELCDQYLLHGCGTKKSSTLATDKGRIERHIKPLIGRKKVQDVTRADVKKVLQDIAQGKTAIDVKTGKRGRAIVKGGQGTATRTVRLLGGIFAYASDCGMIEMSPVVGVKRFADKKGSRYLSQQNLIALGKVLRQAELEDENPSALAIIKLLVFTGARKGEIETLREVSHPYLKSTLRKGNDKVMPRNLKNERIKRQYSDFLKHADGKAEQTIWQIEKAIQRYEVFTDYVDFATFNQQKAKSFKTDLTTKELAKATILSTVTVLKRFFGWLAIQPGYKTKISLSEVEFLSLADKDIRAAKAPADRPIPTLEQILYTIGNMATSTAIEKRNRALVAFTTITGIRDGAAITLKLKHFDGVRRLVLQNPLEVRTKLSKRIDTFLFPLNDHLEQIFIEWIRYLKEVELFAETDPLFPKILIAQDENNCFTPVGLSREHWANATPMRTIFEDAFKRAGLPIYTPHSFRHMIVSQMYARGLTIAEFKAWSQNLGHEGAMTTLTSYGKISVEEQGRLILGSKKLDQDDSLLAQIRSLVTANC